MKGRLALTVFTVLALVVALFGAGASPIAATPNYVLTHLATSAVANDVNASGQVVGSNNTYGWVWENGVLTWLPTLGHQYPYDGANAINASGQIAGYSRALDWQRHAVLWQNGTVTDLGTLGGQYPNSQANAINDAGQIVGWSTTASGQTHAFLWQNGVMADLGTLPGDSHSVATGINASGQIVGWSGSNGYQGRMRAVLWQNGAMIDLGTLGGQYPNSQADAINDMGQIVGWSTTTSGQTHAFLWTPSAPNSATGTMADLHTLAGATYSQATGINNSGHIVGTMNLDGESRAFLWRDGAMTDLNAVVHWGLRWPAAINGSGQIVGYYSISYYDYGAFLLMPNSIVSDAVAPTTSALLSPLPVNSCSKSDLAVTLRAADDEGGTGVKEITYSASGAQPIASTTVSGASAAINLTMEGQTTLTFSAKDNAGNAEAPQNLTVRVDKTPPAISGQQPPPGAAINSSTPEISAVVSDIGSGIDPTSIVLKLDGATVAHTFTASETRADGIVTRGTVAFRPASPLSDGEHTAELTVSDRCGRSAAIMPPPEVTPIAPIVASGSLSFSTAPGTVGGYFCLAGTDAFCLDFTGEQVTIPGTLADGTYTITLTTVDEAGNTTTVSWTFTVDTKSPTTVTTLSAPANAAGWHKADVTVTLGASDAAGGSGVKEIAYSATGAQPIATTTASGASASITIAAEGQTTITFSARDKAGNVEAAQTVTIKLDETAPVVTVPATLTVIAASPAGTAVTYTASAIDALSGIATQGCTPSSGSTFPIGTTRVTCGATDLAGNSASGGFDVIVKGAAGQLSDLSTVVTGLGLDKGTTNSLNSKLQNALAAVKAGQTADACDLLTSFISQTQAQSGKALTVAQANQLIADATRIKAVVGC